MSDNVVINISEQPENIDISIFEPVVPGIGINIGGQGINAVWGSIFGTLSAQTDLWNALLTLDTVIDYFKTSDIEIKNAYITQNLTVGNNTNLLGNLTVNNNTNVKGNLTVDGTIFNNITAVVLGTYFTVVGNGVSNTFTIPHNLNTKNISVVVRDLVTDTLVYPSIQTPTLSSALLSFSMIPQVSAYGVTVFGGVPSSSVPAYGAVPKLVPRANTLYVTVSGNDNNEGTDPNYSLRTIKKACEITHNARVNSFNDPDVKFTIFVGTGDFYEENPVYVPTNTSIIGDNLRRCSIIPKNKQLDILWVDTSTYVWGVTFRQHLEPSCATAFPVLGSPLLTSIAFKNLQTPFIRKTLNYDQAKCFRDVGYLLSAVRTDIVNGNNDESIINGQFYYTGVTSVLPQDQITPTVQAIQQTKALAKSFTNVPESSGALSSIDISFSTIIDIISGGLTNYTALSYTPSPDANIAAALLSANTVNIQNGTLSFINELYPTIYGWRKPFVTTSPYIQGSSSITKGLNSNLQNTFQQKYNNSTYPSALNSILSTGFLFQTVIDIVSGGTSNYISVTGTPPPDSTLAQQLLSSSLPFIQNETVGYINTLYPTLCFDRSLCTRDVGYILSAVYTDLKNGNNNESIYNGQFYYDGVIPELPSDQVTPTVLAIDRARQAAFYVLSGEYSKPTAPLSLSAINSAFDTVISIVSGNANTYTNLTSVRPIDAIKAFNIIEKAKPFIQRSTVTYVNSLYPTLSYTEAKCYRDVGYILSAVQFDVLNGNNKESIRNGRRYYTGFGLLNPVLPNDQVSPTVAAIRETKKLTQQAIIGNFTFNDYLSAEYGPVTAPAVIDNITTCIDTINQIVSNNANNFTNITFNPTDQAARAAELLQIYTPYIQEKTIEFINKEYPYLNYNQDLCYRDVGYILSGIEIDLQTGNNDQSIRSGQAYFTGVIDLTSILPSDQIVPTTRAISEVGRLASYIVKGDYTDRNDIDVTVNTINDIILNGLSSVSLQEYPVHPGALYAAQYIEQNKAFIQKETLGYINATYPDLDYDQDLCYRDVGYILDAIQSDIQTGNNAQGIINGNAYFKGSGVSHLPDNQKVPTIMAFKHIGRLAKFVAQNTPIQGIPAGGGMRVDGLDAEGFLRSFVLDSYTQFNEGGKGIYILNNGYAQLVSIFTICCTEGVLCETGGSCSINTSNCSFGLSGLVSRGKSPTPILSGTLVNNPFRGNEILVNNVNGIDVYPNSGYFNPASPRDTKKIAYAPYNGLLFTIGTDPTLYTIDNNPSLVNGSGTYSVTVPNNIGTNYTPGVPIYFYIRSTITSSAHTFEFVGSGTVLAESVPALGGVSIPENEAVFGDGGVIYFTSTNQAGNFKVGQGFTILQETGTIEGDTFKRSILTLVTPLTLALE